MIRLERVCLKNIMFHVMESKRVIILSSIIVSQQASKHLLYLLVFIFLSLGGLGRQFEWVIITYQVQFTSTCGLQLFGLFIIPFLRPSTMMWWRVEFGGSYGGVSESINGWVT